MITIVLTEEQYAEFLQLLERPAKDIPELKKLLTEPSTFDEIRDYEKI